ncbi:hypothetical protein CNYM01_14166 [Colletotrichum nymphaeae SA-01]|uniref:Uncharacterized protein n=1 Tax=Colletotrichum nymphaeae SA-01 TaxID=1460502 RepID=A0A135URW2_9PEZI|nr:hypothetical protein CNYM01_14166 [Colletotrichum nymphaeae SA-01]
MSGATAPTQAPGLEVTNAAAAERRRRRETTTSPPRPTGTTSTIRRSPPTSRSICAATSGSTRYRSGRGCSTATADARA